MLVESNLEVELLGCNLAPFGGVGFVDKFDSEDGARRVEGPSFLDTDWILTLVTDKT